MTKFQLSLHCYLKYYKIVQVQEPPIILNDEAGISAQVSQQPEGKHDFSYPEEHWVFIFISCVFILMATTTFLFGAQMGRKLHRCMARCLMALGGDHSM